MTEREPDARLQDAIEALRRMPVPDSAARRRLARAIAQERRVRAGRRRGVLRSGLIAATLLVAFSATMWWRVRAAAEAGGVLPVQFVFAASEARSVALAGDFNGWDPTTTPLARGDDGVWSVVLELAPGTFSYSFVIDGNEWRGDPAAPAATDDFGRPSSLRYVTPEVAP